MNLLEVFRDSDDLVAFQPGDIVFEEGAPGDLMYVIVSGAVQLSLEGEPLARLDEGEIFGEMALLESHSRSATASALTGCHLAPIDLHSFKSLIQYNPDFAVHVMSVLADRLRNANWERVSPSH